LIEPFLVAIHVLAATVWVGGTVALVFVAVPIARSFEGPQRASLLAELGRRWRPLGWGSLAVLVASGSALATQHGAFASASASFDTVLAVKLLLVALLATGAFVHDFVLGPKLRRQVRDRAPQTARRRMVAVGWASFALTLAVPLLGVALAELTS
jgi:uncharacterized membrane protein